jgi:hypothetical protein
MLASCCSVSWFSIRITTRVNENEGVRAITNGKSRTGKLCNRQSKFVQLKINVSRQSSCEWFMGNKVPNIFFIYILCINGPSFCDIHFYRFIDSKFPPFQTTLLPSRQSGSEISTITGAIGIMGGIDSRNRPTN